MGCEKFPASLSRVILDVTEDSSYGIQEEEFYQRTDSQS